MTRRRILIAGAVAAPVAAAAVVLWSHGAESLKPCVEAHRRAATYPDYSDAVIPPNIAPLDLKVMENGRRFYLRVSGTAGAPIEMFSSGGTFELPPERWRNLLKANAGSDLKWDIYVKAAAGWMHFDPVRNPVASDKIDPYVVYRWIPPIYDKWGRISLRQRDLRSFDVRTLLDNERSTDPSGKTLGDACFNCHTFLNHGTDRMLLHSRPSRSGQIPAMIVVRNGHAQKVDTRIPGRGAASYPAWHPGGRLIVFSRNSLLQIFHTAGTEVREVVDRDSDLGLYDVETGKIFTVPQISRPDRLETWPAWSPDGRYLYFSSAKQTSTDKRSPPPNWQTIRYDLDRVAFDPETGKWGDVETVVSAARLGRSISEAVVSPDGNFLMFTGHDHGSFPIFQPGADLYLVDLRDTQSLPTTARRLDEIDSGRADSYHSWSSNSRWVIFSSKREDGTFTRLYIAHADPAGHFGKPFILPQKDPEYYRKCTMVFNRPELIAEPVKVSAAELTRAINSEVSRSESTRSSEEPYRPLR